MYYKKIYLVVLLICIQLTVFSQGLSLIAPAVNSTCNSTVDIPVKVKNFQSLLSLQFSMGWDTSKLKFKGITGYGPNVLALTNTNFGISNAVAGQLIFSWNDANQQAQSLTDSTAVFVLQFNVFGNNGSTAAIDFFNTPATIEAIDAGLNTVPVTTVSGAVSINCTVSNPLYLMVPTVTDTCNTTVDIPVRVKNFQNLLSAQFSLVWDTAKLKFVNLVDYGPSSLSLGTTNFGLSTIANGNLSFIWSDAGLNPKTLSDSTILFMVRYNVKGTDGASASIKITSSPTVMEAIDNGLNSITVNSVNGAVQILCPLQSPLNIITPYVNNTCNSIADIPVKVTNFKDILSLQFSLGWDTSGMQFIGVVDYGQPSLALSSANFGLSQSGNGKVGFSWNDINAVSKTLTDTSTLFKLRFKIKKSSINSDSLKIISNPTAVEVIDKSYNSLPYSVSYFLQNIICSNCTITPANRNINVTGCKSLIYKNVTYTTSTVITDTTKSPGGCDSIYTLVNIIVSNIIPTSNTINLSGCNSLVYKSKTYTSSTSFKDTTKSIYSCDSLYNTVNIVIYKIVPVTTSNSFNGCNSVLYNGKTYTSSTVLTDTTKSVNGCDSVYFVHNITVYKIVATTNTTNLKGCGSVTYKSVVYTSSKTINDTIKSVNGCDSIYNIVNIIVSNIIPTSNTINLSNCISLVYKNKTYTSSASFIDTSRSINGCDSIYSTVNIIIYKIIPVTNSINLTGCNSLLYNGKTYTTSTILTDTTKSVTGCDSLYSTHNITIYKIVATTNNNNLSGCGSVTYKSVIYTTSTNVTDTVKSVNGCDSIYNFTTITVTPNLTRDTFATVCGSMYWYGNTYINDTIAKHSITNNVANTFNEGFTGTTTITVPAGWTFSGTLTTYTSAGNYGVASPSLKFAATNDQIVTPALSSAASQLSFWAKSQAASGSSLLIEGYNGTSWVTVNKLTSFPPVGTTISYNATSAPSLPAGLIQFRFTYTKSVGNISFDDVSIQYNKAGGCDSVISLHLTVKKAKTNTINLSGCNSVLYKTKTYTSSAIVSDTVKSFQGCDSIYNIANITVYKVTATTNNLNLTGCNKVLYNNKVYTSSTIVTDTIKSSQGCDSIYKIATIVINTITTAANTINLSGCNAIIYKGQSYNSSATVLDTVKSLLGCDSIYLTVNISIGSGYAIAGNIKHPVKTGAIANVIINLTGNLVQSTTGTGSYSLTCLSSNSSGVIKASKNNDINKVNGVTAVDIALVQSHILAKNLFNSPYKIIAADVTGDGKVTALDIVYMKRLILGIDTSFTNSITKQTRLWAFIDSSYKFPDTTNPFPFKDSISYTGLNADKINQTFIGVKLGDVNMDWNPASLKPSFRQVFIKKDEALLNNNNTKEE